MDAPFEGHYESEEAEPCAACPPGTYR